MQEIYEMGNNNCLMEIILINLKSSNWLHMVLIDENDIEFL